MKEMLQKQLTQSILNKQKYKGLGCPSIIEEICKNNNLTFNIDDEYNSWEVDWWAEITDKDGVLFCDVNGSMYYGTVELTFY